MSRFRRLAPAPFPIVLLELLALATSLAVVAWMASRPIYVPVMGFSMDVQPFYTQSLTGVKGQTFRVADERLSRIDLEVRTEVRAGSWIRVKFELARGVDPRTTLASTIVVFDRSRRAWQMNLALDPTLTRKGEELYLRLEAIVPDHGSRVFYRYSPVYDYKLGRMYELDGPGVQGQDLYFEQYKSPRHPKPLAWAESALSRLYHAAAVSGIAPLWLVVPPFILAALAATVAFAVAVRAAARQLPWRTGALDLITVGAVIVALGLLLAFGGELPFGKVRVALR